MAHLHYMKINKSVYQYLAALTANLCIICSELHYGWPSPSVPILTSGNYTFRITGEEGSWLTVTPVIASPVGMLAVTKLADLLGRKPLIIFSALPFIVGGLLIGFAHSPLPMFIGRFLTGCADGISLVVIPIYLGEIAQPKIRGLLASVYPVCIVFGVLLINILGTFFRIDVVAFIITSVPVLILLTFSWMPETPYFFLIRGNVPKARRSLEKLRGDVDVSEELNRIATAVEEQIGSKRTILDLIKTNRRSIGVGLGLRSLQQLSGVSAIIFYCKSIFEKEDTSVSPEIATILYFTVQLICSMVSSFVVDHCGRKPLLFLSTTGSALALFASGTYLYIKCETSIDVTNLSLFPLAALLCYNVAFSLGLQTIPLLMLSEIFPTNIKTLAVCLVNFHGNILIVFVAKFFYWSTERFGMHIPFFTFSMCCVVGLFFTVWCVPETKGKTLEEIQVELRGVINETC